MWLVMVWDSEAPILKRFNNLWEFISNNLSPSSRIHLGRLRM